MRGDQRHVAVHAGVRPACRDNGDDGLAVRDAARAKGSVTRVGDDQADAAVLEVEGELFLLKGGVERDRHGTERGDGKKCGDKLCVVGLNHRHPVAERHTERAQPASKPLDLVDQLAVANNSRTADDGGLVGSVGGAVIEHF
jgi:hypothetical protein